MIDGPNKQWTEQQQTGHRPPFGTPVFSSHMSGIEPELLSPGAGEGGGVFRSVRGPVSTLRQFSTDKHLCPGDVTRTCPPRPKQCSGAGGLQPGSRTEQICRRHHCVSVLTSHTHPSSYPTTSVLCVFLVFSSSPRPY